MNEFREKCISPFTDYGFERLFTKEPNKDLLLYFLNELPKEQEESISESSYLPIQKNINTHTHNKRQLSDTAVLNRYHK